MPDRVRDDACGKVEAIVSVMTATVYLLSMQLQMEVGDEVEAEVKTLPMSTFGEGFVVVPTAKAKEAK